MSASSGFSVRMGFCSRYFRISQLLFEITASWLMYSGDMQMQRNCTSALTILFSNMMLGWQMSRSYSFIV
ncbi:unknown [Bacteroides sp. CAG:702]|nr:unknown [Bacteroides sp. CAG:702]